MKFDTTLKIRPLIALFFIEVLMAASVQASPVFEYQLWMQAETSLELGVFQIKGKIVNTGTVSLDLTPQWSALTGAHGYDTITTCDSACFHAQLTGNVLLPGESFDLIWLSGEYLSPVGPGGCTADIPGQACASVGLIPLGSDWQWNSGGFIPELLVRSDYVDGPVDESIFNILTISQDLAGNYISGSPLTEVPLPPAVYMYFSGLIGLLLANKASRRTEAS
jgi:hypothetical protein